MKTIRIKSLELINFKGIKSLKLDDLGNETSIYGKNGIGKTTLFDAFIWLLFNKDSTDRKDFEIKTLDKNNNVIPKIDHIVTGVIEVDGVEIVLKKTLKEKWQTKRGFTEPEFTGNETLYEWNGVPLNAGDYTSKINNIVDENVFKMITSTAAFNGMKWQDQRDVLIDLAGNVTDEDVASGYSEFENLVDTLVSEDKTLDEYKKQVKASISKSKQELKTIPTRIDEVERGKPETRDFDKVKSEIKSLDEKIEDVNTKMNDKAKAHQIEVDKKRGIQKEIFDVENEINATNHKLRQEARAKFNKLTQEPKRIENEIKNLDADIKTNEQLIANKEKKIEFNKTQIRSFEKQLEDYKEAWANVNKRTFVMDENECKCPTCNRELSEEDIQGKKEYLEINFNNQKRSELEVITNKGNTVDADRKSLQEQNHTLIKEIGNCKESLKELWSKRADYSNLLNKVNAEPVEEEDIFAELQVENQDFLHGLSNKIKELKSKLQDVPEVDNTELQAEYKTLSRQRDELKMELQEEDRIKQADARIEQLANEEKHLAQSIAEMEKVQYTIEAFEKEKSNRIETSVNNMFKYVNFKLFKTLINGGEEPTCKALINGVPFSDANTASKINAGLDIINTLCYHYGVTAPVFIDNRESVVELIYSPSQIINLIVSEADDKLRVVSMSESMSA
ncbi:hypothetical protein [Gaetbulibacter sp. PBL-D1]|uniref:hypothetical protein n=1 Tax=Gaetbulibacter sp. PBL-D1 TaxID=3422594 RepID=UPI003D2F3238